MPSVSGLCQMISPVLLSYLLLWSKQRHSSCCQLSWRPHESLAAEQLWGPTLQAFMFLFVRRGSWYAYYSLLLGFSFLYWAILLAPVVFLLFLGGYQRTFFEGIPSEAADPFSAVVVGKQSIPIQEN